MENLSKKSGFKLFINMSIAFLILCISTLSYTGFKNVKGSDYDPKLNTELLELKKLNESISCSLNFQNNDIKNDISANIKKLKEIKDNLGLYTSTGEYVLLNLDTAVNNNILLYEQMLSIINNPNAKDVESSIDNLNSYKNSSIDSYIKINKLNSKCIKDITDLINKAYFEFNEILKFNRDKDIKHVQSSEFTSKLESMFNRLPLKNDYLTIIEKCRNNEYNYEVLLNSIEKDLENYNEIKMEFSSLSIPPEAITLYNDFKELLNIYDIYINNWKNGIISEKKYYEIKKLDKNKMEDLNEEVESKYLDLKNSSQRFSKDLEEFKKN